VTPGPPRLSETAIAGRAFGGFLMFVLLKARGFLVVPLYAQLLEPREVGLIALAAGICSLSGGLLNLGLPTGSLLQLTEISDYGHRGGVYRSAVRSAVTLASLGGLLVAATLAWAPLPRALTGLRPFALPVGLLLVGTALRDLSLVVPQLLHRTGWLMALSVAMDYGGAALGLSLVAAHLGAGGMLWGTGAVLTACAGVGIVRGMRALGGGPQTSARRALALGLPMVPVLASQWIFHTLDRFILSGFHGEAAVGIYSVAASLASVVLLLSATWNIMYIPVAAELWRESSERFDRFSDRGIRLAALAVALFVAGACLLGPWGVALIAGPRYAASGRVLPLLVASYGLLVLIQILQAVPMVAEGRTGPVAWAYGWAALANVAVGLSCIPRWGLTGAAASALAGHLVALSLLGFTARKARPGLRPLESLAAPVAVGAVFAFLARWSAVPARDSLLQALGALSLLLVTFALVSVGSGALRKEDLRLMRSLAGGPTA
jgi:O-antigen/teichoic acid export membrane protein